MGNKNNFAICGEENIVDLLCRKLYQRNEESGAESDEKLLRPAWSEHFFEGISNHAAIRQDEEFVIFVRLVQAALSIADKRGGGTNKWHFHLSVISPPPHRQAKFKNQLQRQPPRNPIPQR
jgi:hypothetical protein